MEPTARPRIRVTFRRRAAAYVRKRERTLRVTPNVATVRDALTWARQSLERTSAKLAADVVAVTVEVLPAPKNGQR